MCKMSREIVGLFDKVGYKKYMFRLCAYVGLTHGVLYFMALAYLDRWGLIVDDISMHWYQVRVIGLLFGSSMLCMVFLNTLVRRRCRYSRVVELPLSSGSYLISRLIKTGNLDMELYKTCRGMYENLDELRLSGSAHLCNIQALVCYLSSLQCDREMNLNVDLSRYDALNDKMCSLEYIVVFGRVFVLSYGFSHCI